MQRRAHAAHVCAHRQGRRAAGASRAHYSAGAAPLTSAILPTGLLQSCCSLKKKKKKKKKNLLPARSHHAAAWCLQLDSCCCTCSIGFSCRSPASAVLRTAIDHPPASAAQLSPECQDLLARMLRPMPHERATLQEVAEHPWLASARPCLPPLVVNDRLVRSFH